MSEDNEEYNVIIGYGRYIVNKNNPFEVMINILTTRGA